MDILVAGTEIKRWEPFLHILEGKEDQGVRRVGEVEDEAESVD
jgi:hypothetical protein